MNLLIALLKVLIAYDLWCIGRVAALLRWLEEWLSISQKWAERGLIALYMLLIITTPASGQVLVAIKIFVALWVGTGIWTLHRRPAALRERWRRDKVLALARVFIQVFIGSITVVILFLPRYQPGNCFLGAAQIVYLVFFYMTGIHFGGERGRRRKLAWAELKKLFGTEWMPRPLPAPTN